MILPATHDHYLYVCAHMDPIERAEREALYDDFDPLAYAEHLERLGQGWAALREGGEPVYLGGVMHVHDGVASTWMVHTPAWRYCVREVTREVQRVLEGLLANGTHRVESRSIASAEAAHRWFVRLGFEREAVLRAYGRRGEDFFQFVRLRE